MTKTFVEFEHWDGEFDGYLGCDSRITIEKVATRDVDNFKVADTVNWFRFFDAKNKTTNKRVNYSPRYFYHGLLVKENQVSQGEILFRMSSEALGRPVKQMVRTRHGDYKTFFPGEDILIPNPDDKRNPEKLRFDEHSELGPGKSGKTIITEVP